MTDNFDNKPPRPGVVPASERKERRRRTEGREGREGRDPYRRSGPPRAGTERKYPDQERGPLSGGKFAEHRREPREPRESRESREPREPREFGPEGAAGALIALDQDIMKLLVRRSILISRVREGRDHAASPAAIQAEKSVRAAWEKNSSRFSKDPRFVRNLFDLLQDLKVLSKGEAESQSSYLLNPVRKPVNISLTGPASVRSAAMWTILCAMLNHPSEISPIPLAEALTDCVKTLNQAGFEVLWEEPGTVTVKAGDRPAAPPSLGGKSLFVGESPLTLYLMAFLAAESVGPCRFTGGSALKMADLSGLRHTLPLLGARLAHVVPRSQGLPASIEYSGLIQDHVVIPEDLPLEGVCALLAAPLVWEKAVTIDLGELPGHVAAEALTEAFVLYDMAGADVGTRGSVLHFPQGRAMLPVQADMPLDAGLAAYILALPAFCGGTARLKGVWPHSPMTHDVATLLAFAGVQLAIDKDGVSASVPYGLFPGAPAPEVMAESLHPLYWALMGLKWEQNKENCVLPCIPEGANLTLAGDFLETMRLAWDTPGAGARLAKIDARIDGPTIWTGPDAFWSMGYSLAAFIRPSLRLANPRIVTRVLPYFWGLYNRLPEPPDMASFVPEKKEEPQDDKPARRRIIAD